MDSALNHFLIVAVNKICYDKFVMMRSEIITKNAGQTQRLGKKFISNAVKKKPAKTALVLALEGDLGGGKTTFVQGMARGLGIKEQITSPSFVLIKKYGIRNWELGIRDFYHIDCYRLKKPWQLQELGFEEIINDPKNIIAIEWAERVEEILPEGMIRIRFEWLDEDKRKIIIDNNQKQISNIQ